MVAAVPTAMMTAGLADGPLIGTSRGWSVVGASTIGLTFSLGTLLLYRFGMFVRPLTHEFGWTRTLTAPVRGLLIDRLGPQAVLLPSVVFMAVLVGSLSLLGSPWQCCLTFIAAPFCAGGATRLGYSAVLLRRFERRLGLAFGIFWSAPGRCRPAPASTISAATGPVRCCSRPARLLSPSPCRRHPLPDAMDDSL